MINYILLIVENLVLNAINVFSFVQFSLTNKPTTSANFQANPHRYSIS